MNLRKSLGAGALIMAAASANAQSDVTLYGLVDAMVYRKQLAGEPELSRVGSGGLSTAFWGFRGREDLGGGLSAQFDVSAFFRMDSGSIGRADTDPLFARSSWLGFEGNWGSIRLGRQTSLAFLNLVRYSAFGGSTTFNPSMLHTYQSSVTQPLMTASGAADSVWNNVVSYSSPDLNGFSASAYLVPSVDATAGSRQGGSVNYFGREFAIGLVVENINGMGLNFSKPPANVRIEKSELWNLGASYDLKFAKLFANAIKTDLRNTTTRIELETYGIGANVPVGSGQIMMSYGETKTTQTALAVTQRQTTTLRYDYNLSKRTDLYAVFMQDRASKLADGNGFAFGIRHRY